MATEAPVPKAAGESSVAGAVVGHAVENREPPCGTIKDTVE